MATQLARLTIFLLAALAPAYGQASISGTVLNASDGAPIPGVTLTVSFPYITATTGPDGRFQFPSLKPGDYYVRAEKQGFAKLDGHAIRLSAGETVSNLTLRLTPESSISGHIRDAKGQPVRASVDLTHVDHPTHVAYARTENDGTFRLVALPAGRYKLSAQGPSGSPLTYYPRVLTHSEGSVIQVGSGEHKTGVDVVLREPRIVTVRGRFAGEVPKGGRCFVVAENPNGESRGTIPSGQLDAERRFTLTVVPGASRLKVNYWPQEARPSILGFLDIAVPDTNLDNIVIQASPIRSVRARFNRPVTAEASFTLNPQERLGILQWGKPAGDGTLVANDVSADRYSIMVGGLPEGFYVQAILAAGADITTSGLDLITGTATDLDILLANNGGIVSGQAPAGASIYIGRVSPHRTERELFSYQAVADAAGRFVASGIAPGDYTISARVNGKSSDPQTIRVAAGARLQLTLR